MSLLQKSKILLTVAILLGFSAKPSLAATLTYDAANDFSATNNPNGVWRYGWESTLGSTFNLYNRTDNSADLNGLNAWIDPAIAFSRAPAVVHNGTSRPITSVNSVTLQPGQLGSHPGQSNQYSIIRWVAPQTGTYSIDTTFSGLDFVGPTTTDVHVLYNGTSLFNNFINGFGPSSAQSFATSQLIQAGDTVDFAVGFGQNGNFFQDTTGISATITGTAVPEPSSSLGILAFGAIGALSAVSRKKSKKAL